MCITLVFIATATPGPAVLFITTNSLLHGWQKTIFVAFGNIVGLLCLGLIAITGLGALLKTSVLIYNIIKYAGAAYLIYMGFRMIFKRNAGLEAIKPGQEKIPVSSRKLFFQAFGVAISNPKAIVFLSALLPQFVNIERPLIPQFSVLILTLMLFSFACLLLYSILAYQARAWLVKANRIKTINRTSGSIFVGFGALLAISSNK